MFFGTDGIRGLVDKFITKKFVFKLGYCSGIIFKKFNKNNFNLNIFIGRDTRKSSLILEKFLISGLNFVGINVFKLGVISSPAVAYLTKKNKFLAGIMISASHNTFEYNGIKFFNSFGFKISLFIEKEIEKLLKLKINYNNIKNNFEKNIEYKNGISEYVLSLKKECNLKIYKIKLNICIDCANGATINSVLKLFNELYKIKVNFINIKPNGFNINMKCGSVNILKLKKFVLKKNADIGFAFDGDGDRLITIDEKGNIIDGDMFLYICSKFFKKKIIVSTIISNLGLKKSLKKIGILNIFSKVGDKNVVEKMKKYNSNLGGETSGHIIFLNHYTTGDGIFSALQLLKIISITNKKISKLLIGYKKFYSKIININILNINIINILIIKFLLKKIKFEIKKYGRIVIRVSGTEPLLRILIEMNKKKKMIFYIKKIKKILKKVNILKYERSN